MLLGLWQPIRGRPGLSSIRASGGSGFIDSKEYRRKLFLSGLVGALALVLASLFPVDADAVWGIQVGTNPTELSLNAASGNLYVANSGSSSVSTISLYTNRLVRTTVLSGNPRDVLAVGSVGKVYVAIPNRQEVAVLSADGALVNTIAMGRRSRPSFLAADEARGLLYVANQQERRVSVIDITTDTLLQRIAANVTADDIANSVSLNRIFVSDNGTGQVLAFDPDTGAQVGSRSFGTPATTLLADDLSGLLYVALPQMPGFAVLALSDLSVVATVSTPSAPGGFAIDYPRSRLMVTYQADGQVGFFDLSTYVESRRLPVGSNPVGVVTYETASIAYVANRGSGTISIINLEGMQTIDLVQTARQPLSVALDEPGDRIYVGHYVTDFYDPYSLDAPLQVVQLSTGETLATIPGLGNVFPWGMAVDRANSRLFVSRTYAAKIAVVDTVSNAVSTEVWLGFLPRALVLDSARSRLYISGMFMSDRGIAVVDTNTLTVVGNFASGSEYAGLALDPAGGYLYAAHEPSGTVVKIDVTTGGLVASTSIGGKPLGVALAPDGSRLYVANYDGWRVDVVSATDLSPLGSISIPGPVHTVKAAGSRVAAVSWEAGNTYLIDPDTLSVSGSVSGFALGEATLSSAGTVLYQTLFGDDQLMRAGLG